MEIYIEEEGAAEFLEGVFGIKGSCWGQENQSPEREAQNKAAEVGNDAEEEEVDDDVD